jgi:glycosyltransferase involved in cell wall biosynthesis
MDGFDVPKLERAVDVMSLSGQKILYIFDAGDWGSRMPVALAAKAQGHDVRIVLIGAVNNEQALPDDFTFHHIETPPGRFRGLSLMKMVGQLRTLLLQERADIIHAITLKYSFVTGLAALAFRKTKKIYTLAGLGYLFRGGSKKATLVRTAISPLLKIVLKAPNTTLIFQNPDDLALMVRMNFATSDQSVLIRGSGVDLEKFSAKDEPDITPPIVLMPTRLVKEKGIHIFVEAARLLKAEGVDADFQIAGGLTTHNPQALSQEDMNSFTRDGSVEWLGRVADMPNLLANAALIVYPSYYGEGIPRVLLEACAAGRPIITTDHPGCREAVDEGENGYLAHVRNAKATAAAISVLIEDKALRARMGKASRIKAEKEFDIHHVVAQTLVLYTR